MQEKVIWYSVGVDMSKMCGKFIPSNIIHAFCIINKEPILIVWIVVNTDWYDLLSIINH